MPRTPLTLSRLVPVVALATLAIGCALAAPAQAAKIAEINLGCVDGDRSVCWIELSGATGEYMDPATGLRALDRNGQLLWELRGVYGVLGRFNWIQGRRFVIGTQGVRARVGTWFELNAIMPVPLDSLTGTIVLFKVQGTSTVTLDQVGYGGPGQPSAPPPGTSIDRVGSVWTWIDAPTVDNFYFSSANEISCMFYPRFFVTELALACEDGDPRGQFVELQSVGEPSSFDARVSLRTYDHNGALLATITDPFGARREEPCPTGTRWLLGGPAFAPVGVEEADGVIPVALDPVGGRVDVLGTIPGVAPSVLDSFRYPATGRPLVADGLAYQRQYGDPSTTGLPSPMNSRGQTLGLPLCASGSSGPALFLQELALACADGGEAGQFVEISAIHGDVVLDGRVHLRIIDRTGARIADMPGAFGARTGSTLLSGATFVVASVDFPPLADRMPDARLPVAFDLVAGRVELALVDVQLARDTTLATLAWGDGPLRRPAAGTSLAFDGHSRTSLSAQPSPVNFWGQSLHVVGCHLGGPPHGFVVNELALRVVV